MGHLYVCILDHSWHVIGPPNEVLSALEADFKFHASSSSENSRSPCLTWCATDSMVRADRIPGTIAAHSSQVSPFITNFADKQEPTLIKAIKCYEHAMQLIRTLACLNTFQNTLPKQQELLFALFKTTQPLGTCLHKSL